MSPLVFFPLLKKPVRGACPALLPLPLSPLHLRLCLFGYPVSNRSLYMYFFIIESPVEMELAGWVLWLGGEGEGSW